ncbi:MAG: InlB B-repeat-containing protein [Clostridiales bacterium]|nr:InlB B-repeat-containing protein [Clostridiales bacterium]
MGYTLEGWSLTPDGEQLWDFSSDAVEEDLTLYAVWEAQ